MGRRHRRGLLPPGVVRAARGPRRDARDRPARAAVTAVPRRDRRRAGTLSPRSRSTSTSSRVIPACPRRSHDPRADDQARAVTESRSARWRSTSRPVSSDGSAVAGAYDSRRITRRPIASRRVSHRTTRTCPTPATGPCGSAPLTTWRVRPSLRARPACTPTKNSMSDFVNQSWKCEILLPMHQDIP